MSSNAEGFIYTIQPSETWLGIFERLLNPDGYAVVSYYERYGGFFELVLKAIHAAGKVLSGRPALGTAKLLFEAKRNSIPHTRAFKSWLDGRVGKPFVRHRYFIDAAELCQDAARLGFAVHSAWPSYRDTLDVYWHKKILPSDETMRRALQHLRRSRLSFVGGRKLYLAGRAEVVKSISSSLQCLIRDVDRLIDDPFGDRLAGVISDLASLRRNIEGTEILADDDSDIEAVWCNSRQPLSNILGDRSARSDCFAALTQSDAAFINAWGLPAHLIVLRKRSAISGAES